MHVRPHSLPLQVPLDIRSMWRQRLRWLKGGHLFILSPGSVFFKRQPHMSLYQKALYWLCPVAHFIQLFFEPVIFSLPFLCLVFSTCPYGMDSLLFWTHIAHLGMSFIFSTYHTDLERTRIALSAKGGYRVLWFTSVKACINTIMVHTGWKNPGHFKFTPKAGVSAEEAAVSGALSMSISQSRSDDATKTDGSSSGGGEAKPAANRKPFALSKVHASLSKVTEVRKGVMPLDGTFDIWILLLTMTMSLMAAAVGVKRLYDREALVQWDEGRNGLIWIGVVFAVVDATPGLLFLGCVTPSRALTAAPSPPLQLLCRPRVWQLRRRYAHVPQERRPPPPPPNFVMHVSAAVPCTPSASFYICNPIGRIAPGGRGERIRWLRNTVCAKAAASCASAAATDVLRMLRSRLATVAHACVPRVPSIVASAWSRPSHRPLQGWAIRPCCVLSVLRCPCRYAAVYDCAPWFLKIWVPMITFLAAAAVTLIEVRIAYGFTTGN